MYYSNGDIYEGQWCKDKPDGEGMLRLSECPAPPLRPARLLAPPHLATPSRPRSSWPRRTAPSSGHAPSGHAPAKPRRGEREDQIPALRELIL